MPLQITEGTIEDQKPSLPQPEVSVSQEGSKLRVVLEFETNYPDEAIETSEREIMDVKRGPDGKIVSKTGTGVNRVTSWTFGKAVKVPLGFNINGNPALISAKVSALNPAEKTAADADDDDE